VTEKHVLIEDQHDMFGNQTFEVLQPLIATKSWKVFELVDMILIYKYGQNFKRGIPLSKDFRNEVIQMEATQPIVKFVKDRMKRSAVQFFFHLSTVNQDEVMVQDCKY